MANGKQNAINNLIGMIGGLLLTIGVLLIIIMAIILQQGFTATVFQVQLLGAAITGFFLMVSGLLLVVLKKLNQSNNQDSTQDTSQDAS